MTHLCVKQLHHFGIKGPLLHGIRSADDYLSRQDLYDEIRTPILIENILSQGYWKSQRSPRRSTLRWLRLRILTFLRGEDRQLSESVDIQTEMLYGGASRDELKKAEYILLKVGF